MHKLLIADDEPLVRYILHTLIDWPSQGFETIDEAEDGITALALLEQKKPNLILLDIKMPGINGMEFMAQAARIHPATRIIMVSGHSEFAYVQEALRNPCVVDYLLKPVERDELQCAVCNVKKHLHREEEYAREETRFQSSVEAWNTEEPWLRELLTEMARKPVGEARLSEVAAHNNMSLSGISELFKRRVV